MDEDSLSVFNSLGKNFFNLKKKIINFNLYNLKLIFKILLHDSYILATSKCAFNLHNKFHDKFQKEFSLDTPNFLPFSFIEFHAFYIKCVALDCELKNAAKRKSKKTFLEFLYK